MRHLLRWRWSRRPLPEISRQLVPWANLKDRLPDGTEAIKKLLVVSAEAARTIYWRWLIYLNMDLGIMTN
jgi:hypothetical protein